MQKKIIIFIFLVTLIALGLFLFKDTIKLKIFTQDNGIQSVKPVVKPTDRVYGIQVNKCCSCPTLIESSLIGEDGWVKYEQGKNYSSLLPESCKLVDCQPCITSTPPGFCIPINFEADNLYDNRCSSQNNKEDCLKVDYYNIDKNLYNPDGMSDCSWNDPVY